MNDTHLSGSGARVADRFLAFSALMPVVEQRELHRFARAKPSHEGGGRE